MRERWMVAVGCLVGACSGTAASNDAGSGGNVGAGGAATSVGGGSSSSDSADGAGVGGNGGADVGAETGGAPPLEPFKGVANSPCNVRQALGVSWYYNWTQGESEPCAEDSGGAFVPMVWGHEGAERTPAGVAAAVASFAGQGYDWVLGFNEPDNPSQSDIPADDAIELWPSFLHPSVRVASPATAANANPGQAWFTDFMNQLNGDDTLVADVLAVHWYGWNAGSCDADASQLENYLNWVEGFAGDRPIWLTEWGCLNQSAPDTATVVAFYQGALEVFAEHPRVHRYAWYPWATNCGLADESGELTALGQAYAAAPAHR